MKGIDLFCKQYRMELHKRVTANPQDYPWYPATDIDTVADRMARAFHAGTFNKDSDSIRAICKHFGIKHTYAAMREYFNMEIK